MRIMLIALLLAASVGGCRAWREERAQRKDKPSVRRHREAPVRRVVCLFDQRPWLNADAAGDRDPEGIQFRVFLDADDSKGVLREGTLHVELYLIERKDGGEITRNLASDWHYATQQFNTVKANILGMGYHVQLRWAKKDIAGHEIELTAKFEDSEGRVTRAGTKRLRVPNYAP